MHSICCDQGSENAARDDVTDKMVIHRNQADEHRSGKNNRYHSSSGHRNHPYPGESKDSARVPGWKTADIVASLKRMKPVCACADQRGIIMRPRLRPIAPENVP